MEAEKCEGISYRRKFLCVQQGKKENFLLKSAEMAGARFGFGFASSQKLALVLPLPPLPTMPAPTPPSPLYVCV